jgi:hypothetical protein
MSVPSKPSAFNPFSVSQLRSAISALSFFMQLFSTEQKSLEINVKSVQPAKTGCPDRCSDHIVVLPFNFHGEK